MAQEKKAAPDWERIEADYRAGILSLREIASQQSVSHQAVAKRAKAQGWERDLAAKIKSKAEALVAKRLVDASVDGKRAATEQEVVSAGAEALARIKTAHRTDIARGRRLAMALLEEMESETGNIDLFRELGEIMRSDDEKGSDRRNDLYNKVISSAGRIDSMKKLAETMKTLVGLEREAYGIVEAQKTDINLKIDGSQKAQDMTDDELAAYITGSGAGVADSA